MPCAASDSSLLRRVNAPRNSFDHPALTIAGCPGNFAVLPISSQRIGPMRSRLSVIELSCSCAFGWRCVMANPRRYTVAVRSRLRSRDASVESADDGQVSDRRPSAGLPDVSRRGLVSRWQSFGGRCQFDTWSASGWTRAPATTR